MSDDDQLTLVLELQHETPRRVRYEPAHGQAVVGSLFLEKKVAVRIGMPDRLIAMLFVEDASERALRVPDKRAPEFVSEAHRQSEAVAASEHAETDQAFIDEISRSETW